MDNIIQIPNPNNDNLHQEITAMVEAINSSDQVDYISILQDTAQIISAMMKNKEYNEITFSDQDGDQFPFLRTIFMNTLVVHELLKTNT